jgi:MraZ protein
MLIGEYETKIGDKKRVAIPKKFRDELGENLILTRGYEGTLILVNKEMWEKIAKEVIEGSFINKNIRDTTRFLVGSAVEVETDSQGRIVIPNSLHKYGDFEKQAVFVGLYNWIEIWDKKRWEERLKYLDENSEDIAREIQNLNSGNDGKTS